MARLCDLKKFLKSKNPTRVTSSKTTRSEYYYFGAYKIRISDHIEINVDRASKCLSIIPNVNDGNVYTVSFGFRTFTLNYTDTKRMIEGYLWFFPITETPEYLEVVGAHSYREEYLNSLDQISLLASISLDKDEELQKLRETNKKLIKDYKSLANASNIKVHTLKNKTSKVRELENVIKGLMGELDRKTKQIENFKTYESEIEELKKENARLASINTELEDKRKFVESRISELISGI